ncbi:MAG TPA: GspE/PulE family protein [Lacunisphaera sp.]|jgi:type IV pilus assembly protein PilB|nr:GspE/PulE family protein [Lacunisphaera sp.]
MYAGHDQAIHDLLAERRLVDAAVLRETFASCRSGSRSFAAALIEQGIVGQPDLLRAVAAHLECEVALEVPETLPPDAIALLDPATARAYGVVPLAEDARAVSLLAADPFNPNLVGDLAFLLGREARPVVADPAQVRRLIERYYGDGGPATDASLEPAIPGVEADGGESLSATDLTLLAGQAPVVRLVNQVLALVVREQASDVHFEPFEDEFKIRCRIDGALADLPPQPRRLALPVTSRLKVLANLDIAERRLPQDGRMRVLAGGRSVDLRVSTLPTQFGESVVLRVLDQAAVQLELGQLGMPPAIQAGTEEILRRPDGIFLVTGPTGSGKTTTLYSCLKVLNRIEVKVLTVEDPVEYELDGVMQVPVNLAADLTFARTLRAFLRQDPDVIMVGEIRDVETAQVAIQAALTGHVVLSTLHTNDAPGAVTRLMDMGVAPILLASTLEGIVAQRLLRRICPACRAPQVPAEHGLRRLGLDREALRDRPVHAGRGCESCRGTGYKGRLGIFEFLRITDRLRERIVRGASLAELREVALADGMIPLREAAIAALLSGATTLDEVLKHT